MVTYCYYSVVVAIVVEVNIGVIAGDIYLRDSQIPREDKEYLYPKMVESIKKVTNSIIIVFSPITLPNLVNYDHHYNNIK